MAQGIVAGSAVLGRFVWEKDGHHVYICRKFRVSPRPPGANTLAMAELLDRQYGPYLCSMVASAWNYLGCWCRCLLPTWDGSDDEVSFNGPYAPWGTADPLPAQVAGLIFLRTAAVPAIHIGRMYLPPADETANFDGKPTATYLAALANLAAWMEVPHQQVIAPHSTPLGATPIVWSSGSTFSRIVVSCSAGALWATQRRRAGTQKMVGQPFQPGPGVE